MRRHRKNLRKTIFNIVGLVVIISMALSGLLMTIISSRSTPTPFPTLPGPTTPPATDTPLATAPSTHTPTVTFTPVDTLPPTATSIATTEPTLTDAPPPTATATVTPTTTLLPAGTSTITPTATTTPVAGLATPIPLGSRDAESFSDNQGGAAVYREIPRHVEHPQAFHHYVRVTINGTDIATEVVKVEL